MKKIILLLFLFLFIIGCAKQTPQEIPKEITCQEYCEQQPHIQCVGNWEISGEYPNCNCKFNCEIEEVKAEPQTEEPVQQTPPKKEDLKKPTSPNPVDELSDETIQKWNADCKDKKTDLEKANCILDWQEKNIFWCYTHPETTTMPGCFEKGYPDCVVDMQFQQMKHGSFPVSKIMDIKTRNGKIFGACYTYATTYCAIARWNGLKCRVMSVKIITPMEYPASKGDFAPGYCGAAPKDFLDKLGLDCNEWRKLDWTISDDHYWAEVLIDGTWKIMEKPLWAYKRDTQKNIIDAGRSYKDTGW